MRKDLLLILIIVLWAGGAMAQERSITGKVTSKDDGQPVPGANVVVQGTGRGTSTDAEGNFKLTLESSDNTIAISFIGFKTYVLTVGAQTMFNVVLESEATSLQEVVVVGYGVQK